METEIAGLLAFITKAEKLKTQVRHSWLSDSKRQESVAEHSWMLGLIAMSIFDSLDTKVDQLKVLKMVILHDLAEAITGDIPTFEKSERQTNKYENEKVAFKEITKDLPPNIAQEFMGIWLEMEQNTTAEAKLAQCLDKVEVWIQHIIADIKTWDEGDYEVGIYHKDEYFDFHPFLREFKDQVIKQFWTKMEHENKLDAVKPAELKRYKQTR
mgnify:CR=1 FL=1